MLTCQCQWMWFPLAEIRTEIQSCDLKFYLKEQNSDNAWIKGGGWTLLNVETLGYSGLHKDEEVHRVWLTRQVKVTPEVREVLGVEKEYVAIDPFTVVERVPRDPRVTST